MHTMDTPTTPEVIAQLLVTDLADIGDVSFEPRLTGMALLEDGVMFGYVDNDGTPYLRATEQTAARFHALGSVKHSEMPYWSIPHGISADKGTLHEIAYEAAEAAHLAFSFDISDTPAAAPTTPAPLRTIMSLVLLAA